MRISMAGERTIPRMTALLSFLLIGCPPMKDKTRTPIDVAHDDADIPPPRIRYDKHPKAPLSLGVGFSPDRIDQPRLDCFSYTEQTQTSVEGQKIKLTYVESAFDTYDAEGFDAAVSARYLTFDASASLAQKLSAAIHSDAVTIVVRSEGIFKTIRAADPVPKLRYQKLLDNKAYPDFERACGSRLVIKDYRGAKLFLILTITKYDRKELSDFKASVEASGGVLVAGGSLKASFNRLVTKAVGDRAVTVDVTAEGVDASTLAVATFTTALTDADPLEKISGALRDALKPNYNQLSSMYFDTVGMDLFGWHAPRSYFDEQTVIKIAQRVSLLGRYLGFAESVLTILPSPFANDMRHVVEAERDDLGRVRKVLMDAHASCLAGHACTLPPDSPAETKQRIASIKASYEQYWAGPLPPAPLPLPLPLPPKLVVAQGDYLLVNVEKLWKLILDNQQVNDCTNYSSSSHWAETSEAVPQDKLRDIVSAASLEFTRYEVPSGTPRNVSCPVSTLPFEIHGNVGIIRLSNACNQFAGGDPVVVWFRQQATWPLINRIIGKICPNHPADNNWGAGWWPPPLAFDGSIVGVGNGAAVSQ
jgi:hypothetical protein